MRAFAQLAQRLAIRYGRDEVAYREVGTYRGAAQMCGVDHKTAKRIIEKNTGQRAVVARRAAAPANYEIVRTLVAAKLDKTLAQ